MRMFILLLVLVNVALFAYFNMDKVLPKKALTYKELNPGKLKLLMDEGDFKAIQLYMAYMYGKPKETKDITISSEQPLFDL